MKEKTVLATYEEKKEWVQEFNLTSDLFASKVFEDMGASQELCRILLRDQSVVLQDVRTQYVIRNLVTHSMELDILAERDGGDMVGIEIQMYAETAPFKRTRYYLSGIDMNILEKGKDYDALPAVTMVYLTKKDIVGGRNGFYLVERKVDSCAKSADISSGKSAGISNVKSADISNGNPASISSENSADTGNEKPTSSGSEKSMDFRNGISACFSSETKDTIDISNGVKEWYYNLSYPTGDEKVDELLKYFKNSDPYYRTETFPRIVERVRHFKINEGGVDIMCEIADRIRNEGREEGREEGRSVGRLESRIEDILELLGELGQVPQRIVELISAEENLSVLSRWLKTAARAGSIAEFEADM